MSRCHLSFFFFNDTATTEIYTLSHTLSLHDALPIYSGQCRDAPGLQPVEEIGERRSEEHTSELQSHSEISYAVFCLKKKKETHIQKSIQTGILFILLTTPVLVQNQSNPDPRGSFLRSLAFFFF